MGELENTERMATTLTRDDLCTVELPAKDRVWPYTRTEPCGLPGQERVTDAAGVTGVVCALHARTILRQVSE